MATNFGLLSLGSGAFDGSTAGYFKGFASGSVIAANAASGYGGNLMDLQVAGSSKAKISASGALTIAGALDASSNKITNLATPTASTDAATKAYVDSKGSPSNWTRTIRNSGSTWAGATVSCSGNEKLITGRCSADGAGTRAVESRPTAGGQGWYCTSASSSVAVYANCCEYSLDF